VVVCVECLPTAPAEMWRNKPCAVREVWFTGLTRALAVAWRRGPVCAYVRTCVGYAEYSQAVYIQIRGYEHTRTGKIDPRVALGAF